MAFAEAHETPWPRDLRAHLEAGHFDPPPHNALIGPIFPRGAPNGLVLHRGKLVASWGDTRQADMTFSVAKSYLSLLAGVAWGDGLLTDLDEPVRAKIRDGGFESDQNAGITWRHLLTLTSEWEGELFGKSDAIDRGRPLGREALGGNDPKRALQPPGSYFEYNDVRVNRLSLCLLRLFRRPLAEVFHERIMEPVGASRDWVWYPYDNAVVDVDGIRAALRPRWLALGRRHADACRGPGADRPARPAARRMGGTPARPRRMDRDVHGARRQPDLWLPLVAQRDRPLPRSPARQRLRLRRRRQLHLDLARGRGGGGAALGGRHGASALLRHGCGRRAELSPPPQNTRLMVNAKPSGATAVSEPSATVPGPAAEPEENDTPPR